MRRLALLIALILAPSARGYDSDYAGLGFVCNALGYTSAFQSEFDSGATQYSDMATAYSAAAYHASIAAWLSEDVGVLYTNSYYSYLYAYYAYVYATIDYTYTLNAASYNASVYSYYASLYELNAFLSLFDSATQITRASTTGFGVAFTTETSAPSNGGCPSGGSTCP